MTRFLIASLPVTGHVHPGLPIARALVERGHEVWWYTGQKFRARVEATGARYVPMQAAYDYDDSDTNAAFPGRAGRSGLAGLKWDLKHLFYDLLPGQLADLRSILRAFPADALLADTGFLGAGALHELGGPPYAIYGITALTLGSRDTAPFGLGLPPASSPLGRMRNQALAALFERAIFRDVAAHANGVRDTLGLPPLQRGVLDVRSPFLYLQSSTPAFEYPRSDLPPQVHFIGPLLPEAPRDFAPPPWWGELQGRKPVVLVNQDTLATNPADLIVPALRALEGEDMLVVATTGGVSAEHIARAWSSALDAEQAAAARQVAMSVGMMGGLGYYHVPALPHPITQESSNHNRLPANARVARFIPFGALLPHVDVMITNGGYGGVQFALAHGVPLVVAGAPEIAARVAWSGAGINLKTRAPTPEQIRAAVRGVLENPGYRQNARRIQADYARHNGPQAAAALLERLAATGRPVLRGEPAIDAGPLRMRMAIDS